MWSLILVAAMSSAAYEPIRLEPGSYAQERLLCSTARTVVWSSLVGAGKSYGLCMDAHVWCSSIPGAHAALTRVERASMESTTLVALWKIVSAEQKAWGWREQKSVLHYPNGSMLHVFGWLDPGSHLGAEFSWMGVDQAEQLSEQQVAFLTTRLRQTRDRYGRELPRKLVYVMNPEGPDHWAYTRFRPDDGMRVARDQAGNEFEVILSREEDNLANLPSDYRQDLESLKGTVWYDRLVRGRWVAAAGAIFGAVYNPAIHVVPAPPEWERWGWLPPPTWPRHRALDFGINNPSTCLWAATSPDGVDYVYRQWGRTGHIPSAVGAEVLRLEADELATLRAHVRDADEGRDLWPYLRELNLESSWSDHELGWRGELEKAGVWTSPAQKDIHQCIQAIVRGLQNGPNGPRLRIVRGSLLERDPALSLSRVPIGLEEEIPRYRFREWKPGMADDRKDMPVDQNNHWIDALGYLLNSRGQQMRIGYVGSGDEPATDAGWRRT